MLYNAVRQTGPNLYRVAASFTRPSDTTQYGTGDLVANSTTAASVVPLSWTIARTVTGLLKIKRAIIRKSDNDVTGADFRVHVFNATPTIATAGDNSAFASVVSGYTSWVAMFRCATALAFATGAVGDGIMEDSQGNYGWQAIVAPASGRILYGLIEARNTYTPASAETFTVELEVERA